MKHKIDALWRCPYCQRQFINKNQWHSCVIIPVKDHFEGKPKKLKETYDYLVDKLKKIGPVKIDAVKTGINFGRPSHFAMVFPKKNVLKLGFLLNRKLNNPRVQMEAMGHGRYAYHVVLNSKKDINNELFSWLKESYFLSS